MRSAAAADYVTLGCVAWLLASRVFSLIFYPDWRVWIIGIIAGTLIVSMSGLLANRRILNAPPVESLRET